MSKDHPGVVDRISQVIADHGGNWLDSRMAHLSTKFAGVVRVEVPQAKAVAMCSALAALDGINVHTTVEKGDDGRPESGVLLELELIGPDHPGIVHEISHFFAERGVSVEEMETDTRAAPMAGGTLFHAWAKVRMPAHEDEDDLQDALDVLASSLMVDVTLTQVTKT